jgi:hypothetical protein
MARQGFPGPDVDPCPQQMGGEAEPEDALGFGWSDRLFGKTDGGGGVGVGFGGFRADLYGSAGPTIAAG